MDNQIVEEVTEWGSRPFSGGYDGLRALADEEFTGAVTNGVAWLFLLNGRVVAAVDGSMSAFENADGTAYEAPHPSVPLLFAMQERGGETKAKYYTEETPLSDVDQTLSAGNFTGYIELSENVLSGDYYVLYHGGRSLACAFIGNSRTLLTGDEALERADDEVGIYEVYDVDVDVIPIPGGADRTGRAAAGSSEGSAGSVEASTDSNDQAAGDGDDAAPGAGGGGAGTDGRNGGDGAVAGADDAAAGTGTALDGVGGVGDGLDEYVSDGLDGVGRGRTSADAAEDDGLETAPTAADDDSDEGPVADDPPVDAGAGTDDENATGSEIAEESVGGSSDSAAVDSETHSGRPADEQPSTEADPVASDPTTATAEAEVGEGSGETSESSEQVGEGSGEISDGFEEEIGEGSEQEAAGASERADTRRSEQADTRGSERSDTEGVGRAAAGADELAESEADAPKSGEETEDPFSEEAEWRETQSIPSLDPSKSETQASQSAPDQEVDTAPAEATGTQSIGSRSDAAVEETNTDERAATGAVTDEREVARLREQLRELEAAREEAETAKERLAVEREELETERDEYRQRAQELQARVEELEAEVERLEAALEDADSTGGTAATHTMPATEALAGTNLFVRYETKGGATLERVHAGEVEREAVVENLRLEHHTSFDTEGLQVAGDPFETFLRGTVEYRFVRWVVEDLLYEIRDTGHQAELQKLFDSIPDIDRAELDGTVSVEFEENGEPHREQEQFDVVLRDRMGNPLIVANLNSVRDPASGEMMTDLIETARRVKDTSDTLGSAFLVTTSYFQPDALETADDATGGGLLGRGKRKSFVKLSRKRGFHLCLVETRDGNFHVNVPEL